MRIFGYEITVTKITDEPIKKIIPDVGSQWVLKNRTNDPFCPTVLVEITDVKGDFVQYKYYSFPTKSFGMKSSEAIPMFLKLFSQVGNI